MDKLKINRTGLTLVDQVEEKLIDYFKEQGLRPGSSIPNEAELAASLGIGRTVLREALSRFKMTGMIESRTKRGMILAEPSILCSLNRCVNPLLMKDNTIREIFEFRLVLEIGCTAALFAKVTPDDIDSLTKIVQMEKATEKIYATTEHCQFHEKIYAIVDNTMITEFQEAIKPALDHVMKAYKDSFLTVEKGLRKKGELVTHADLLEYIKNGDAAGYNDAIVKHFSIYLDYVFPESVQ